MIAWSDKFSTGVPHLDQQHQGLFRMVNGLEEEHAAGTAAERLTRLRSNAK